MRHAIGALAVIGLMAAAVVVAAAETLPAGQVAVVRAASPAAALASGAIAQDGSVQSGSGNFRAVWDGRHRWYYITINGVSYDFMAHRTVVQGAAPAGHGWCLADSLAGDLIVRCFDVAGAPVQAGFAFTTF